MVWMTGLLSAPIAGWYTAMLRDEEPRREVTVAKPIASAAAPVAEAAAGAVESAEQAQGDELARTKADLAKLLAALESPDANSAIENHTLLKSQIAELSKARDVATAALYKPGAAGSEQGNTRVAELSRQLSEARQAGEKSRRQVASLEALRDAQGWHSPSCPTCPRDSSTTNLAPVGHQQEPVQWPVLVPVESGQVIVCFQ
jgi:hypothetical protein